MIQECTQMSQLVLTTNSPVNEVWGETVHISKESMFYVDIVLVHGDASVLGSLGLSF